MSTSNQDPKVHPTPDELRLFLELITRVEKGVRAEEESAGSRLEGIVTARPQGMAENDR